MKIQFQIEESSSLPIYAQVAAQIDRHLHASGARRGARLPDLRSLAGMAGVSLNTADRALKELVRRGICVRRPKKGAFFGLPAAAAPKALAAIYHARGLSSFERDLVQAAIYRGIAQRAATRGLDLFFLAQDADASLEFYRRQAVLAVKGVAMLHWESLDAGRELAARFPDMRWVYINYWLADFAQTPANVYGVFNDDRGGAYQMTEHLLRRGHRRIALLGLDMPNFRQRAEGYRQCLLDHGRPADPRLTCLHPLAAGQDLRRLGAELAQTMLAARRSITAIFCVNDIMAAGAGDYLRQSGAAARVQVAGYDHIIPALSQEGNFSTVAVDFEAMGEKALDLMARPRPDDQKITRVMPRLIIRNNDGRGPDEGGISGA